MNYLLTNDDGIDASGLAALERAVSERRDLETTTTVAPAEHHSGCGHQTTTSRALRTESRAERRFALDGTPADCARIGLLHVAGDVDWVLSGINEGGNLGVDVFMSGTVAAVREAALLGKPGIAFSQYRKNGKADWDCAARWTARVLDHLLDRPLEPGAFWNVNFPDPTDAVEDPEIVECPLDPHPLPVRFEDHEGGYIYRGAYHERARRTGGDVDVCFAGNIAVTLIPNHGVPV